MMHTRISSGASAGHSETTDNSVGALLPVGVGEGTSPTDNPHLCACGCGQVTSIATKTNRQRGIAKGQPLRFVVGHNGHPGKAHGETDTPTWRSWQNMRVRCTNPKHHKYANYGGRGISVCEEWLRSYEAFRRDMGERPANTTLDRIDNNRGYEPGNCRWADDKTQQRNRRTTRLLTFRGKTQCVADWARETGISRQLIRSRLVLGWSLDRTLSTPATSQ